MERDTMFQNVITNTIQIKGKPLYYEQRGIGPHFVLLIPGGLGTGALHFSNQHFGFDLTKFTLISVDPIGYGKSRPASRPTHRYFWYDAEVYHILMEELGVGQYSILGFCDGGRVGLIMGAKYQKEILKIVTSAASAYVTEEEREAGIALRARYNYSNLPHAKELESIFGEETQLLWEQFVDSFLQYRNILKEELPNIKCPVFILHGSLDRFISVGHATYLRDHILNVKLYVHKHGGHYFHMKDYIQFNMLVQEFLLE